MFVYANAHDFAGSSVSVNMKLYMCALHTDMHKLSLKNRNFLLHSGLESAEQHRGLTVCTKPTVHSFLSHWTFNHSIWTTKTRLNSAGFKECEKVWEMNMTSSDLYEHAVFWYFLFYLDILIEIFNILFILS